LQVRSCYPTDSNKAMKKTHHWLQPFSVPITALLGKDVADTIVQLCRTGTQIGLQQQYT